MKPVGICGVARAGKDTLFLALKDASPNRSWVRVAFADALKKECSEFLLNNTGISPFTDKDEEKELIRPFLVAYGTHLRRKINPNCWIDVIKEEVRSSTRSSTPVITDVRYENELEWIKSEGGTVIHVSRAGVLPANKEEEDNDPFLKKKSDIQISWPTFKGNYLERCKKIAKETISSLKI